MNIKRPSFQFYPGDWLQDAALRLVSPAARGLWIDMICLMHQGSEYGYLMVNNKVIHEDNLARFVGASVEEVNEWLLELGSTGVFSRDNGGCIYSRRMIRDEKLRRFRAECGKLSQNNPNVPRTKANKDTHKSKTSISLPPSPSSSSSSSSSKRVKAIRFHKDSILSTEWLEWACKERKDLTPTKVNEIFYTFKDHWLAKAGPDGTKLDWFATWRNWIRREKQFSGNGADEGKPTHYDIPRFVPPKGILHGWWTTPEKADAQAEKHGIKWNPLLSRAQYYFQIYEAGK